MLVNHKIDIIPGVNDIPSISTSPNHPNEALLCKRYNDLIDELSIVTNIPIVLQDILVAGNNITILYNNDHTITISAADGGGGGGGGLTQEDVEDIVAAVTGLIRAGDGITRVYADNGAAAGTLTIGARADQLLTAGTNITLTYNAGTNRVTIDSTASGLTQEEIEDFISNNANGLIRTGNGITRVYADNGASAGTLTIGARPDQLLEQGNNITLTYNSTPNTVTIAAANPGLTTTEVEDLIGATIIDSVSIVADYDTGANKVSLNTRTQIVTEPNAFTVGATHHLKWVEASENINIDITLPNGLPNNFETIIQKTDPAGAITFVVEAGGELQAADNKIRLTSQYTVAHAFHKGGNVWSLTGAGLTL